MTLCGDVRPVGEAVLLQRDVVTILLRRSTKADSGLVERASQPSPHSGGYGRSFGAEQFVNPASHVLGRRYYACFRPRKAGIRLDEVDRREHADLSKVTETAGTAVSGAMA